ncbi:MAG: hypothetical protein DRO11_04725 [Methanobacteriota archaeon]|nr:MAG: hypothetical protein DRO11_04725 [Euryarchaeota archaeon]
MVDQNREEKGNNQKECVGVLKMVSRATLGSLLAAIILIAFVGASSVLALAEEEPSVVVDPGRVQELRRACEAGDQTACEELRQIPKLLAKRGQELRRACEEGDQAACERLQALRRAAILRAQSFAQRNFVARGVGFAFQGGNIDHYHHLEIKILKDVRPRNIVSRIFAILERFEGQIVSKELIERVRRALVEDEMLVGVLQFDDQKYQLKNLEFKEGELKSDIYQPTTDGETEVGHIHLWRGENTKQPISVGSMELNGLDYRVFIHIETHPMQRLVAPQQPRQPRQQ